MAAPTEEDEAKLRRILRYLKGAPRMTITMEKGENAGGIDAYIDSDFAGCTRTRKSTSGGGVMWRGSLMKAWAKTVQTLALSSGEAELAALTRGAAESMGLKAILRDLCLDADIELFFRCDGGIGHRWSSRPGAYTPHSGVGSLGPTTS